MKIGVSDRRLCFPITFYSLFICIVEAFFSRVKQTNTSHSQPARQPASQHQQPWTKKKMVHQIKNWKIKRYYERGLCVLIPSAFRFGIRFSKIKQKANNAISVLRLFVECDLLVVFFFYIPSLFFFCFIYIQTLD